MNDNLLLKPLVLANISGDDFGTEITLPRVASPNRDESLRRYTDGGTVSVTLRISHQPGKATAPVNRSLFGVGYELKRVDGETGALSATDKVAFNCQINVPPGINLTEFKVGLAYAVGALVQNADAIYNLET